MINAIEIRDQLLNAIQSKGLKFTASGRRRCNSVESCRILANAVCTKLEVMGYKEEDVPPAICMSADILCKDWVSLARLSDSVVTRYVAEVPVPEPKSQSGSDSDSGDGERTPDTENGAPEENAGKGDSEGGEEKESADSEDREKKDSEDGTGEKKEGEKKEGEGKAVSEPVPVPERVPDEDGYLRPREYEMVKNLMEKGFHVCLVGPRGTGKTELILKVTRELNRNLYMLTSPQTRYEVTGYADATGKEVPTQITLAITDDNGLLVLEELDRSMPEALIPMNAMLANNIMDVPVRGMVNVSPGLLIAATANTNGHGRTEEYGTAQKLDASTMDRFVVVYMDYDPAIDKACATNAKGKVDNKLVDFVTDYRRACMETGLGEYTVSYRGVKNIKKIADMYDIRTALDLALVKAAISKDDLATICHSLKCRNAYANELKNLQAAMKE